MPAAQVADFITGAAVFGVMLGGRLGYAIFYNLNGTLHDPLSFFRVWQGGMSSHGGILGLVLFTFYFARRHSLSWTSIADSLVVVGPIGVFVVRCANFINGELYGRVSQVPWAMQFPAELYENPNLAALAGASEDLPVNRIIAEARHDPALAERLRDLLPPRHPSQLYEALLEGVVLFAALWLLRTRMRLPRGVITGAFFVLYALLRIVGEMFREPDPAWHMGPFSAGQFLSLFMFVIGAVFVVSGLKNPRYESALIRKCAADSYET